MILNGNMDVLNEREAAADFDQNTTDLQTMTLQSFRKAMAVSFDKGTVRRYDFPGPFRRLWHHRLDLCVRSRDRCYLPLHRAGQEGPCATSTVWIPASSLLLDDAVGSITGYDPEEAKELFIEAYNEAIEAGYITDSNGDGISDQIRPSFTPLSADNDFITKTLDYLNEKLAEVTAGTPFEGKIMFTKSPAYGNDWSTMLKSGMSGYLPGCWTGSKFDPVWPVRPVCEPPLTSMMPAGSMLPPWI